MSKCRVCEVELDDENWTSSKQKNGSCICKKCVREYNCLYKEANIDKIKAQKDLWKKNNPDNTRSAYIKHRQKYGMLSMSENKECAAYLGIFWTEKVLSNIYTDVVRMPMNYPGYDIICNKGKKVDAKSACITKNRNSWQFNIRRNTIADYFICVAFDNREDLTPVHIWLLPGDKFNHLMTASISQSTLHKWEEYEISIDKVLACCETMKARENKAIERT